MSNGFVAKPDSPISEREIVPSDTGRISRVEETVLGAAYVGTGIFLRDSRRSRSGNDKEVHRNARKRRGK